ncbi:Uncharacterized membrane protein YjjB, DUF3815 family [Pustulibacterium marinum]|uniref:Uncharacterized membrane protein YjjB, DUF3815 family n=1 Tax=Pustulibacterium marinum TaxID=1224947 RepID=A0A1I7EVK8_9FLAO|nr:threonine/serine exporter family protein [Pustulibacterium marinum]SFU27925.1 Uncharacterized membrane protein YjjB, DUF3815 family [Pustulibacterium marinum]
MEYVDLLEKWIWFGIAAIGFAALFNVPKRTLLSVFILAALGGTVKLIFFFVTESVVIGTLLGAITVGFLSVIAAHKNHTPPFVLAIPAVIPMVPGSFAYHTMKGIIHLTNNTNSDLFVSLLNDTMTNGLKTMFILLSIALGVSMPMLLTRRESVKEIKIPSLKK